jgi:F-type H+-transporting ATPase subunit delta
VSANELAGRYALALLGAAEAQGVAAQVTAELGALAGLMARQAPLRDCLANPAVPAGVKAAVLDDILAPAALPLTRAFVALLAGSRREALLPAIDRALEAARREAAGIVKARVESALPLAEADQADVRRRLAQWLDKQVELEVAVVPDLIAGFTVRVGDRLVDASCRGLLARLRQALTA